MNRFLRDFALGTRLLLKSPGFGLVATASLAIGLGASITIFCFVNSILLKPLDARDPARLVRGYSGGSDPLATVKYDDYKEYRDHNQTLSSLAMFHWGGLVPVRIADTTEMIHAMPVTGNYFDTLGVPAAMGRTIEPSDDTLAASAAVLLSDTCWRLHFHSDPNVIGRVISIKHVPFTIVGVTPQWFRGAIGGPIVPQFYIPWQQLPQSGKLDFGHLIGRLNPGVTRAQAQADLSTIAARLSQTQNRDVSIQLSRATVLAPGFIGNMTAIAALFMAIVSLVLLIICGNIAVLLLARSAARKREFGVRLALGASAGQLVRQLLAESLVLALAGGLGACSLAFVTAKLLSQIYLPVPMPIALEFVFDWRVVAFAIAASLISMLLFALGPALESARTDVTSSLKTSPSAARIAGSGGRFGIVAAQIGMSTVLLVTTVTLVHSLSVLKSTNGGFSTDRVLMATLNFSAADYTPQQGVAFLDRALAAVAARNWVVSATFADNVPLTGNSPLAQDNLQKTPGAEQRSRNAKIQPPPVYINRVSTGHFVTLGIPLISGRDFTATDNSVSPAVGIVNQTLASRFWPGESPLGKQLFSKDGSAVQIVGIARDSKYVSLDEAPKAMLYRPLAQSYVSLVTLLVKTTGDPAKAAPFLQKELDRLDPNLVAYNFNTLESRVGLALAPNRAAAILAGILGALAFALGTVGVYGTMAVLVAQRRREIAIRMAVGGERRAVVNLIVTQGMRWTISGIAVGVVAAFFVTRLLRGLLFGIAAVDPLSLVAVTLLLAAAAYLACFVPARRATRADPLIALRED